MPEPDRTVMCACGMHTQTGGGTRRNTSNAPGEQMEQAISVALSPILGAVDEEGLTPAEERRRQDAVRRTSRARFASLATPSRHGVRPISRLPRGRHIILGCAVLPRGASALSVWVSLTRVCHSMLLLLHQVAAARATMAARRDARARNSVSLTGGPRAALATPPTATGTEADGGVDSSPAATTAAFGRRSAAAAAAAVPMHPSGASTERSHRAGAAAERRRDAGQQQGQGTMSARAGRRAAAAPVGGGPGLMAVRATCMADRTEKPRNLSHSRCCSSRLTLHAINPTYLSCCAVCGTRPCDHHRGLRRQQRYGLSLATSCVRLQCVRHFLSWH
jgi:hypothetical protein